MFVSELGQYWSTARLEWVTAESPYLAMWRDSDNASIQCSTVLELDELLHAAGLSALSPLPQRDIQALAFRQRFTQDERLAIHVAAMSVPTVALWVADATAAQTIDVLAAETVAGIDALIAAGLLAPERKAQILRRGE